MVVDFERKARGAFFTPPELTEFISSWAICSPDDQVLEPSCGEASFLLAAADRLQALGGRPDATQLHGFEIHAPSAAAAREILRQTNADAEIAVGDFFDQPPRPEFDALIGNPPYIRYQQFTGAARAKGQAAALAGGVQLPGLASSWAAFVVHAAQFLVPSGRLGLVLPAELLHVNYAAPVRRFLLERFRRVTLITFERLVFPDVQADVVLLLAEGQGPSEFIHVAPLRGLDGLEQLRTTLGLAKSWKPEHPSAKWVGALLPAGAADAYVDVLASRTFTVLSEMGSISLGAVTGNNDYFALTSQQVDDLGLSQEDTIRISPPGSRHFKDLSFTTRALQRQTELEQATYLFRPHLLPSAGAIRYIAAGEKAGVHQAYKCRMRSPWWIVPLSNEPDLFFTYMNHDVPRFVANEARVQYVNSLHGVVLYPGNRDIGRELLPIASLNSITALGAELGGRSYGGGILKLEPREAAILPVPSRDTLVAARPALRAVRRQVSAALRKGEISKAVAIVDEALLIGFLKIPRRQVAAIQAARRALRERRQGRGAPR